jgi:ribosomal-protein-alanine N-acetyltransferase
VEHKFVPMTAEHAHTIVEQWKYDGEYSIYDYSNEADHILDSSAWGVGLFAILDGTGELVGELSIEFFDESDHYTDYDKYGDTALINSREMWVGCGLRPDLVGRRLGPELVRASVQYAVEHCNYAGEYVRLGVAAFNKRAIKAYERAGFQVYEHAVGEIAGREYEVLHMRIRIGAG